jgi:hypothetical protein
MTMIYLRIRQARALVICLLAASVSAFAPGGLQQRPLQSRIRTGESTSKQRPLASFSRKVQVLVDTKSKSDKLNVNVLPTESIAQAADDWILESQQIKQAPENQSAMNRRIFFGSALMGTAAALSPDVVDAAEPMWEATPVNKRTGVTVFDAEKAGYNVRFVTYLAKFLLNFDSDCQQWWYSRAADIPLRASAKEVDAIRTTQFAAFSASVEVGLQEYRGNAGRGPSQLMDSLLKRYCPTMEMVREKRSARNMSSLSDAQEEKELREIKEARRQIALLFGLMETNQPVDKLDQLLACVDNGSITSVVVENGGSGYAPGYGVPLVVFPPPNAGDEFESAAGRAILSPNGKILRLDLVNRGFGYLKPPTVTISVPADPNGRAAVFTAVVFKSGVNKGRLGRLILVDAGEGYADGEKIRIVISGPELRQEQGGVTASAKAIPELQVSGIEIVKPGSGYAVEKSVSVYVDPPPLTARVNMNDPLMARIIDPSQPLPATTIPSTEMRKKMPRLDDPNSVAAIADTLANNDGKGGGGGCIGRACYDTTVVAYATVTASESSFSGFRNEGDALKPINDEEKATKRVISGTVSGGIPSPFWTGGSTSSSAELLTLLPAGIGLEYDTKGTRFALAAEPDFVEKNRQWIKDDTPLDPEFGPRGRSPIERERQLDVASYLRFCLSGAICCAGVHLIVTPIDVVKTKVQTDPERYPGAVAAFNKVVTDDGIGGFFAGWLVTFMGWFIWGGFTYSLTEQLRRYLTEYAGTQASGLEVPIILFSSASAAFFGVFLLSPFEAVRIRSVAQSQDGTNPVTVTKKMVEVSLALCCLGVDYLKTVV